MSQTKKGKTPEDRKPKAPKVEQHDDGISVTLRGMTVTVPRDAMDDWELLDAVSQMDADRPESIAHMPGILRKLLGEPQMKTILDHLRDAKTGRVPVAAAVEFIMELFKAINPKV